MLPFHEAATNLVCAQLWGLSSEKLAAQLRRECVGAPAFTPEIDGKCGEALTGCDLSNVLLEWLEQRPPTLWLR